MSDTKLVEVNGGETPVVQFTLYKLGSGKTLVEVPEGTDYAALSDLLGGEGKKVQLGGVDVREKQGKVAQTDAGSTVTVGAAQGKAGL